MFNSEKIKFIKYDIDYLIIKKYKRFLNNYIASDGSINRDCNTLMMVYIDIPIPLL